MLRFQSSLLYAVLLLAGSTNAFVPQSSRMIGLRQPSWSLKMSSALAVEMTNGPDRSKDFSVPKEKARFALFRMGKGDKQKVLNVHGMWVALVSILINPIWILAMTVVGLYHRINKNFDPNRSLFDRTGKIWAKWWLFLTRSYPTKSGNLEQLKGKGPGPCLFVANHSAWLDIAVVCTVLSPVFKFIAKGDLKQVPGIGQQLVGGKHILIDREDRKSQIKTFKDGIGWLKKGVPLMAFPEGTRSKSGRLMDFKGGMFSMALKMGVPIIPLTISNAHAVWPPYALLPIQPGAGKLHVHVHDAIESKGKTDDELASLVREAFMSTLPDNQLPLPPATPEIEPEKKEEEPKAEQKTEEKSS